jgi:hypothetical protein
VPDPLGFVEQIGALGQQVGDGVLVGVGAGWPKLVPGTEAVQRLGKAGGRLLRR